MRMHSTSECRQIVDALEKRGLYFMEQRPGSARPSTARPLTATPHQSPPHSGSPYFNARPSASHPFTSQVVEAGSLSQVRSEAQRPNNGTSSEPQSTFGVTNKMLAPKLIARDEALAPRVVASTRPSTAQLYRPGSPGSLITHPATFDSQRVEQEIHSSTLSKPPTFHSEVGNTTIQAIDRDGHESRPQAVAKATLSSDTFDQDGTPTFHSAASAVESSDRPEAARPAPSSSLVFPETLEHEIPPRRELPFPRPDSRRSGCGTAAPRPRSALTLPPLPRPRLSTQTSVTASEMTSARPASAARPQTSMPLKRTFADVKSSSSAIERPSTASPEKTSAITRALSPDAPIKKRSRMEELLEGRKQSLEKSSSNRVNRIDSLADAPGEEDDMLVGKEPSPSKTPYPRDSMSPVRRPDDEAFANAYTAVSSGAGRDYSLARYAEQSFEDRQAALEDFMMQNLENPDFTKLCKDVENCWKRIALGL